MYAGEGEGVGQCGALSVTQDPVQKRGERHGGRVFSGARVETTRRFSLFWPPLLVGLALPRTPACQLKVTLHSSVFLLFSLSLSLSLCLNPSPVSVRFAPFQTAPSTRWCPPTTTTRSACTTTPSGRAPKSPTVSFARRPQRHRVARAACAALTSGAHPCVSSPSRLHGHGEDWL